MALKMKQKSSFGIEVQDAYHRIEGISLLSKERIQFSVCVYADVNSAPFMSNIYSCGYNLSGENPIKQAYEYVKNLPEFSNAQDC